MCEDRTCALVFQHEDGRRDGPGDPWTESSRAPGARPVFDVRHHTGSSEHSREQVWSPFADGDTEAQRGEWLVQGHVVGTLRSYESNPDGLIPEPRQMGDFGSRNG